MALGEGLPDTFIDTVCDADMSVKDSASNAEMHSESASTPATVVKPGLLFSRVVAPSTPTAMGDNVNKHTLPAAMPIRTLNKSTEDNKHQLSKRERDNDPPWKIASYGHRAKDLHSRNEMHAPTAISHAEATADKLCKSIRIANSDTRPVVGKAQPQHTENRETMNSPSAAAGPSSRAKGKTIDGCNWGNVDIPDYELAEE